MNDVSSSQLTRRSLLRLGAGAAAASTGTAILAGCSDHGPEAEPEHSPDTPTDTVAIPAHVPFRAAEPDLMGQNGSADGFLNYPVDPPETVPETPGDGKPITAMLSIHYPAWPAVSDNAAWANLNEQVGSDIEFLQVPEYSASFATRVAGDDLPTMMEIDSVARLPELLDAKFIDLTDHLAGDAVKKYPNLANIPPESWQAAVYNDAIYGIPSCRGMWQTSIVFQRNDLIEARGQNADQVSSFDDFVALCTELTGSSVAALAQQPVRYIKQMLGVPNEWRLENGSLVHAYEVPEQEAALEALLRLDQAGVLRPDWHTLNAEQVRQTFLAGQTLMCNGSYQAWSRFHRQFHGDGEFDLDALPLPGFDGGSGTFHPGEPAWSFGAISKGNEDRLETLLQVCNYLLAPFGSKEHLTVIYGKEDVDYVLEGSDPVQTEQGQREAMLLTTLMCAPQVAYYPNDVSVTRKIHAHMSAMASGTVATNPALYRYSETQSQDGPGLRRIVEDVFTDIVLGRKKISEWTGAVANWRENGGDQIRAELEDALANA